MSTCYSSLQVCALRVAKLDVNGNASPGASNGYRSNALINAKLGLEISEGDNFEVKNGCGSICSTFKDCDHVKGVNVELELCQLDSELIYLLTGGSLFSSAASVIGMKLPAIDSSCDNGVVLELWSKAWNNASQAQPAALGTVNAYWHWVMPKVRFRLGDITLENDVATIPVSGFGEENDALNIDGPYNDWIAGVATGNGMLDSSLGWWLDTTLPTTACGFFTVPSQGS